jgi:hypothetical protein
VLVEFAAANSEQPAVEPSRHEADLKHAASTLERANPHKQRQEFEKMLDSYDVPDLNSPSKRIKNSYQ